MIRASAIDVRRAVLAVAILIPFAGESRSAAAADPEAASAKERFFETRVRPLLAGHCFECHGPKKQEAGLRLDSREAMLTGGDSSGPVIAPGEPAKSRLIEVVRYVDEDVQMPPKGKLPDGDIGALVAWIKDGAVWPASARTRPKADSPKENADGAIDFEQARRSHWAFRSVERVDVPDVTTGGWCRTPIDRFILSRLESAGLSPSPGADRRTLIRRVTFDLTGLPPTIEEVEAFANDRSPDAFAKVVDRLLASPHYGERWGRHWLDIARYADTKGYVFASEIRYPYAYTYRDYVIRAFNEDVPYDRFVLEQLAADRLDDAQAVGNALRGVPQAPDRARMPGDSAERHRGRSLQALGFLTVGRRFRNNTHDIIDDRIDVVTRGLMGLTIACARCHDHKYDPVPTEDYYSLYGVFAGSYEPDDLPLVGEPDETPEYLGYKKELDKRQAALDRHIDENHRKLLDELRTNVSDYLQTVVRQSGMVDEEYALSFDAGEPRPQVVARWRAYLRRTSQQKDPVWAAWHALAALPEKEFPQKAAAWIERHKLQPVAEDGKTAVDPRVIDALAAKPPESMYDVAKVYGELLSEFHKNRAAAQDTSSETERLARVLYSRGTPTALTSDESQRLFDRATKNKLRELKTQVEKWRVSSPSAPPRAMVLLDSPNPQTPHVLVRGNPSRKGKAVPRRFPQVLADVAEGPFEDGSGRLELARAIVAPENPLTARVLVNRVWMHHFGEGLVRTPSDFGTRSEPPSHPELLDWLAWTFMHEDGWSIKKLHRRILLSAVYRQASDDDVGKRGVDPENRLLWRMPRRRLGFEAMRDSLLAAAGRLDRTIGGRPVDLLKEPFTGRRTVYGFVNRNNLPGLFRIFDFANPDASTSERPQTTVPQQALFAMNSPFVIEQAKRLAGHPDVASQSDPAARIRALYRRAFSREPDPAELELGLRFVGSGRTADGSAEMAAWQKYAQVLLLSNEFLFVD